MAENAGLHARLVDQTREAGVVEERQRLAGDLRMPVMGGVEAITRLRERGLLG
ncbi:hypothetical protein ACQEU6_26455 [Spirillospora sp. CA-108201]